MVKLQLVMVNELAPYIENGLILEFDDDVSEVYDLCAQICDVGVYDTDAKIYYPSNRIYEIKVLDEK